jgi:hypothetical protein
VAWLPARARGAVGGRRAGPSGAWQQAELPQAGFTYRSGSGLEEGVGSGPRRGDGLASPARVAIALGRISLIRVA